ncbi:MAG: DeoR family transcriptional regulator [Anaerolineales bacterium]|nr:DeoR family transcriptional regulator [Anaerolineales bacterium]
MPTDDRLEQIVALVEERGFISVKELSKFQGVSEVTIRRDLQQLHLQKRLRRTYGGAVSLSSMLHTEPLPLPAVEGFLTDKVDVLIATSLDPHSDSILLDRAARRNIPVIAESSDMHGVKTVVAVDNYQASLTLGRWAGEYALQHFGGRAHVLDLTYSFKQYSDSQPGLYHRAKRDFTGSPGYPVHQRSISLAHRLSTDHRRAESISSH